jgi:hypothetical protein
MADEGVAAVAEAPVADVSSPISDGGESTQSTEPSAAPPERLDGRNQPDALKKRISELRRTADSIADPKEKAAFLADAKALNDKVGKNEAYEKIYPTVREAREVKTLVDSFGGKDGLVKVQETLSTVEAVDKALERGDPSITKLLWDDAPDGMVKLAPIIFSELEARNPAAYESAVMPHVVKSLEGGNFGGALAELRQSLQKGDGPAILETIKKMENWFNWRKQQAEHVPQVDPKVKELEAKLTETQTAEQQRAVDSAYNEVVQHAGPIIDRYLKPIVAKLGLSKEQYNALRRDTWSHLETTRNADATYKTVSSTKLRQGMDATTAYIKAETENRAQDAARARANFWYGHQLKNGAVTKPNPTANPVAPGVTRGKEPSPSEIDYSAKGIAAAKKAGFRDLGDMILAGRAPLKTGGVRQWR